MSGGSAVKALSEDAELPDEVLDLARDLIRLDTSNPPGRETQAAELVAAYLRGAGVECELVGPDPERLNLVARVRGSGGGPSLLLMAHTDVVAAPHAGWSVPPFEGTLRDGRLLGRGAADMKGELAARAVAIAALARSGERPRGDVVLIAESDEERNVSDVGMSWLTREREDARCDFALNEGGGLLLELASGRRVVTVSVGEKPVTSLRLRFGGRAGHASVPTAADNPLGHAARGVQALLGARQPARFAPEVREALVGLGAPAGDDEAIVEWGASQHPVLADLLQAMCRTTLTPTGFATYEPANVIPPYADVICDCRALPGETEAELRHRFAAALGDGFRYELELLEPLAGGTASPLDTPLYRVLEEYVRDRVPGAELLPILSTGFTDSHWVRAAHGTVAYGFAPVLSTPPEVYMRGIHSADESLDVADLVEMVSFHLRAARAVAG